MSTQYFKEFAAQVAKRFATMSTGELYRTSVSGDELWKLYLKAFPDGTNPIFRERTEHDGSYDRAFIRKFGNIVRINDDFSVTTLWDIPNPPYPYDVVARQLLEAVVDAEITGIFRTKERKLGVISNVENRDGVTTQFHHFHAETANTHYDAAPDTATGNAATTVQVFRRGLDEITPQAVADVLELMEQGNLYRGDEFKNIVGMFARVQAQYRSKNERGRNRLVWYIYKSPAARIRNTVIGQLLQDLSEGKGLEESVRAYERMVAPTNYKRPTALITQGMIDKAMDTIDTMGLRPALDRRFATIDDVSVNDVLWADSSAQAHMRDGLRDMLTKEAKPSKPPKDDTVVDMGVNEFVRAVLPTATGVEVFLSGGHQSNLVSLTAPIHDDAPSLFKWGNGFAWSYNGNVADSIKEKVKAAGGNVDAVLRVSLAWHNYDDLDIHADCPDGHVYYGAPRGSSYSAYRTDRILDVDMNAGGGTTRTPVENLSWVAPKDGQYDIYVHQFSKRETADVGFTVEVENSGSTTQYYYNKAVVGHVPVVKFAVKDNEITHTGASRYVTTARASQSVWGVATEKFVKVRTVLNSPNHWGDSAIGNKHWVFILDGCTNDKPARGIYNEFLKPELEQHRKVFEVLGNKTKCAPTARQLSGLGFSSTKRDSVLVRVQNESSNRLYKVQF